ncbi:hypothetical protein [Dinghuibacter silviterrae]|uniref:Uncharacterized protein n=1 Tax=Dinghuibacter silviterrae TaxID=1539049 RepID=A0A4R8DMZ2_9BACT|nr:hypothetical protein [Dinghuibacter silviterrae]TDW99379.1 hypothetical protein EDB95_0389 [Dinghuibacter silviterrae]
MSFFLRAKHWQIFVLVVGPAFISFAILVAAMIIFKRFELLPWFFLPMVLVNIVQYCWFFIVGNKLYRNLPGKVRLSRGLFGFCAIYPCLYVLFFAAVWAPLFFRGMLISNGDTNPLAFLVIFPFHFLAAICTLFVFYFAAKALRSVELQKPARSSDYIGDFFLMVFFIVGVWVLQPRINKIFDEQI